MTTKSAGPLLKIICVIFLISGCVSVLLGFTLYTASGGDGAIMIAATLVLCGAALNVMAGVMGLKGKLKWANTCALCILIIGIINLVSTILGISQGTVDYLSLSSSLVQLVLPLLFLYALRREMIR